MSSLFHAPIPENEPKYAYTIPEIKKFILSGELPPEVSEDLAGTEVVVGQHQISPLPHRIKGGEWVYEASVSIYLERLIVALEAAGKLATAEFFTIEAADKDANRSTEVTHTGNGSFRNLETGNVFTGEDIARRYMAKLNAA